MFCIGSNYVWTWETNRVVREIVTSAGGRVLAERLLELGETAVDHIVKEIIERKPPVVFNTLVGESSYSFMRALHQAATRANLAIPMLSCSLCEPELKLIGSSASVGCITSSAYFESIDGAENRAFVGALEGAPRREQQPVGRWTVNVCLRHAAGPRHPAGGLGGSRRGPPRCGKSSL